MLAVMMAILEKANLVMNNNILSVQLRKSKSSTAFLDNKIPYGQTNNLVLKKHYINL